MSEQRALARQVLRQVRTALGERNDAEKPVVTLVSGLVAENARLRAAITEIVTVCHHMAGNRSLHNAAGYWLEAERIIQLAQALEPPASPTDGRDG